MVDRRTPYERDVLPFVRPFTAALVGSLDGGAGQPRRFTRMLDHGSGTGEVILAMGGRLDGTAIVALDPNPHMATRLRDRFSAHPRVTVCVSTLAAMALPGQFDLITSQLAMPFVPDPAKEF